VEAANVLLTRIERPYPPREWGLRIMQRAGLKKAQVAVARKLATMLHAMWTDRTEFEWRSEMA
jgi:transposase